MSACPRLLQLKPFGNRRLACLCIAAVLSCLGGQNGSFSSKQAVGGPPREEASDDPSSVEAGDPPPLLERYLAASLKEAQSKLEQDINTLRTAQKLSDRQAARRQLKEWLRAELPPHPKLNVHTPVVGEVGVLPEPHRVMQVEGDVVTFLRDSYRNKGSVKEESHYIQVQGLKKSAYRAGEVIELPLVLELIDTRNGVKVRGLDIFVARPIPDSFFTENAEALQAAWSQFQAEHKRWK